MTTLVKGAPERGAFRTRRGRAIRRARHRFLEFFPDGFQDDVYIETERSYKWQAHRTWMSQLDRVTYRELLDAAAYEDIATRAIRIESRTNMLFSFEKMALRDAVRTPDGARTFAVGLHDWIYGSGNQRASFEQWLVAVASLPRRKTRIFTWPVVTVFGFIARPRVHMILKPNVTRAAAQRYEFPFHYHSVPQWETYADLLAFARQIRVDQADLGPRDMIDAQSFIWVQGSAEYD
jgi:hypothetical protein